MLSNTHLAFNRRRTETTAFAQDTLKPWNGVKDYKPVLQRGSQITGSTTVL